MPGYVGVTLAGVVHQQLAFLRALDIDAAVAPEVE